jgi:hypothetical protein
MAGQASGRRLRVKRLLAVMGAVALAAALSFPANAGNEPLVFARDSIQRDQPVEQQSPDFFFGPGTHPETWVNNPTPCSWDVDDHESLVGTGNVAASVSGSLCVVSDGLYSFAHYEVAQVSVHAATDNLTVTLSNDFGQSWVIPALGSGHSFTYVLCIAQIRPGPYPTIPDSNGGYGFIVTYTLTIATTKAAHGVYAILQTEGNGGGIYSIC